MRINAWNAHNAQDYRITLGISSRSRVNPDIFCMDCKLIGGRSLAVWGAKEVRLAVCY